MNFLEAVQALKDGQCEGVSINKASFCKYSLTRQGWLGMDGEFGMQRSLDDYLADDWQLVNPRPLTETKEVKRWLHVQNGLEIGHTDNQTVAQEWNDNPNYGYAVVELIGTYEAPVKPKVKRREELPRGNWPLVYSEMSEDTRIFAEWEE